MNAHHKTEGKSPKANRYMPPPRDEYDEARLDEALEASYPASDPLPMQPGIVRDAGWHKRARASSTE